MCIERSLIREELGRGGASDGLTRSARSARGANAALRGRTTLSALLDLWLLPSELPTNPVDGNGGVEEEDSGGEDAEDGHEDVLRHAVGLLGFGIGLSLGSLRGVSLRSLLSGCGSLGSFRSGGGSLCILGSSGVSLSSLRSGDRLGILSSSVGGFVSLSSSGGAST